MNKSTLWTVLIVGILLAGGMYFRYRDAGLDERGATRLMRAFEEQAQTKDTLRLIKRSEDLNVRDKSGQTALFYAARYTQDDALLREMLAAGANLHAADREGKTPLMIAAQYNPSPEVVSVFAVNGAHVNAADNRGDTALMLAAKGNTSDVIKMLLRSKADPDLKNNQGQSAADLLAENEKLSTEEKVDYRQAMLILSILKPFDE